MIHNMKTCHDVWWSKQNKSHGKKNDRKNLRDLKKLIRTWQRWGAGGVQGVETVGHTHRERVRSERAWVRSILKPLCSAYFRTQVCFHLASRCCSAYFFFVLLSFFSTLVFFILIRMHIWLSAFCLLRKMGSQRTYSAHAIEDHSHFAYYVLNGKNAEGDQCGVIHKVH